MKIAYLLHSYREYDELIETINQLIKQGDHVFIIINDNDLREQMRFVYAEDSKVHVTRKQEFAQEGDLSLARGTMLQMKEAYDYTDFDYFINLSDGMLPIKTRDEIVFFLEKNDTDFYYVDRSEEEDAELKRKFQRYYTYTNLLSFPKSKFIRSFTKGNARFLDLLGIRRKLVDTIFIGSPWFIIKQDTAKLLVNDFAYVSDTFKLSWYPEENFLPMMLHKMNHFDHINNDLRVIGDSGHWIESQGAKPITQELIDANKEALFAGMITATDTLAVYERYFDIYNR